MLRQSSCFGNASLLSSSHWLEADVLQGHLQALAMALLAVAHVRVAVAWGIRRCDDGCSIGQVGEGIELRAFALVVSQSPVIVADGLRVDAGGGDDILGRRSALHASACSLVDPVMADTHDRVLFAYTHLVSNSCLLLDLLQALLGCRLQR